MWSFSFDVISNNFTNNCSNLKQSLSFAAIQKELIIVRCFLWDDQNHNCRCCCIGLGLRLSQKLVGQCIRQTDHSVVTTDTIKGVSIVDYGVAVAGPSSASVHSPLDLIGSSILFRRVHLFLVPLASTATCPWRRQFSRQWWLPPLSAYQQNHHGLCSTLLLQQCEHRSHQ